MNNTLRDITNQLIEVENEYAIQLRKMLTLEAKYTERYNKLMLNSPMGNQALREAQAIETMRLEPIFNEYKEAQLEQRIIWSKKNTLIEISKNLRTMGGGE